MALPHQAGDCPDGTVAYGGGGQRRDLLRLRPPRPVHLRHRARRQDMDLCRNRRPGHPLAGGRDALRAPAAARPHPRRGRRGQHDRWPFEGTKLPPAVAAATAGKLSGALSLPHLPRRLIRRRPERCRQRNKSWMKRPAEQRALGAKYEALTEEATRRSSRSIRRHFISRAKLHHVLAGRLQPPALILRM